MKLNKVCKYLFYKPVKICMYESDYLLSEQTVSI